MKCVYLEVGHSHCCDHSKHNKEHASNDRLWDGDKNCSKFSKYSQDDHQNTCCLDDQSTANLEKKSAQEIVIQYERGLQFLPGHIVGKILNLKQTRVTGNNVKKIC